MMKFINHIVQMMIVGTRSPHRLLQRLIDPFIAKKGFKQVPAVVVIVVVAGVTPIVLHIFFLHFALIHGGQCAC
jgi:hypothetical protein